VHENGDASLTKSRGDHGENITGKQGWRKSCEDGREQRACQACKKESQRSVRRSSSVDQGRAEKDAIQQREPRRSETTDGSPTRTSQMIRESLLGALAGLAATVPMTAVMKLGHRRLPWYERYPLPPRQITMKLARAAGIRHHLDEDRRKGLTLASHYSYGAAMGGLFGAISASAAAGDGMKSDIGRGTVFGLGVWAGSYLGLLPELGILKPATEHPLERNLLMMGAHVVWGVSLARLFRTMQTTVSEEIPDRNEHVP
jgi:hypothetical protein